MGKTNVTIDYDYFEESFDIGFLEDLDKAVHMNYFALSTNNKNEISKLNKILNDNREKIKKFSDRLEQINENKNEYNRLLNTKNILQKSSEDTREEIGKIINPILTNAANKINYHMVSKGKEKIGYLYGDSIDAEILISKILEGKYNDYEEDIIKKHQAKLYSDRQNPILEVFQKKLFQSSNVYISNVGKASTAANKKINADSTFIHNPNTGRAIKTSGRIFKNVYKTKSNILELFKSRNMKDIIYPDLSYNTQNYKIKDNCVISYLNSKKIKVTLSNRKVCSENPNIKMEDPMSNKEFFNLAKLFNFGYIARIITKDIIDSYDPIDKLFTIDYISENDHMYVLKNKKTSKAIINNKTCNFTNIYTNEITINYNKIYNDKKQEISSGTIVLPTEGYTNAFNQIRNDCYLLAYNDDYFNYKDIRFINDRENNYKIEYDILYDLKKDFRGKYSTIDSFLKLRGTISNDLYNTLRSSMKIRIFTLQDADNVIQIDMNKAYCSQFYKKIEFPKTNVNSTFQKYIDQRIVNHYLYYCTLSNPDNILCPNNNYYFGMTVKIMQKKNMIQNITHFMELESVTINKQTIDKLTNQKTYFTLLRKYIGSLARHDSVTDECYDMNESNLDNCVSQFFDKLDVNESNDNDKIICRINNCFRQRKSGYVANMYICELTNIDLYNKNQEILLNNPQLILNSVKTDSLGYISNVKKTTKIVGIFDNELGNFKIEKSGLIPVKKYYNVRDPIKPKVIKNNNYQFEIDNITDIINQRQSFSMFGAGGLGKTYTLNNVIIPYMKQNNITYRVFGTTTEVVNSLDNTLSNVKTIQSLLKLKRIQSRIELQDIVYIIIDECSQLTATDIVMLEQLYDNSYKFILIGDDCQCDSADGHNYLKTPIINKIVDYNHVIFKFREGFCRYTKELYDKLELLRNTINDYSSFQKILTTEFEMRGIEDSRTNLHIAYTNKTCKQLAIQGKVCITIHKAQGKTIDEPYTIHDIGLLMNMKQTNTIYTALSRATKVKDIFIKIDKK